MAEPYKHAYTVDLSKPLKRFDVGDILASGDEKANCFEITVCRGEESVDLSGVAVYGYFIRPNDETFKVDGTVEGNVVRLEPSKSCYVFDGAFSLAVKLVGSGTTQTIAVLDGRIVRTTSENIVDGERVFYSLEEMLAQIEVMEVASRNASAAAENANTATERANLAASAIENVTASATGLEAGAEASVEVADRDGAKHFSFSIPRGEKGEKGDPGNIDNVTITSIDGLTEALNAKLPVGGHPANKYLGTDSAGNVVEKERPVISVNGMTGEVVIEPEEVVETDPTVPAWAKAEHPPTYTAADVGAAPATEDENNPGCYYRIVQGVQEWLNPPMTLGEEYRTSERWCGKAVYAKLFDFGALPNATSAYVSFNPSGTIDSLVELRASYYIAANVTGYAGQLLENGRCYAASYGSVVIQTSKDESGTTAMILVKYTLK